MNDPWIVSKEELMHLFDPAPGDEVENQDSCTCRTCGGPTNMREPTVCLPCQVGRKSAR
jgi:hypothetical protein